MTGDEPGAVSQDATAKAQKAKDTYGTYLLGLPNVVGVGVGLRMRRNKPTGEVALVVMVSKKVPAVELAPHELIPTVLDGIPVDVMEVGDLRAGG